MWFCWLHQFMTYSSHSTSIPEAMVPCQKLVAYSPLGLGGSYCPEQRSSVFWEFCSKGMEKWWDCCLCDLTWDKKMHGGWMNENLIQHNLMSKCFWTLCSTEKESALTLVECNIENNKMFFSLTDGNFPLFSFSDFLWQTQDSTWIIHAVLAVFYIQLLSQMSELGKTST